MALSAFLWATPLKRATTICAFVAALGSAIAAASVIEPYVPAWRGYVREIADLRVAEYRPTVNSLLRWRAEDELSKIDAERAQWNIKLSSEQDPQTKAMMEGRLKQLNAEKTRVEQRINELSAPPSSTGSTAK